MLEKVPLGSTGMQVTRVSFGCLPLHRITKEEAVTLLRRAYDAVSYTHLYVLPRLLARS